MASSLHVIGSLAMALLLGACKQPPRTSSVIEFEDADAGVRIETIHYEGTNWKVVSMDPAKSIPSVRFADANGVPLRDFSVFANRARADGESIIWMMNAGMFHWGGAPVGLCICDGKEVSPINRADGKGNFFLKPNGIFLIDDSGGRVIETSEWDPKMAASAHSATQSGLLLVRQGNLHPFIRQNSPNKYIRNGVGVRKDGHLCFVISTETVSFYEMAVFLRDHLKCPDALYLDGSVSALYAPKAGLTEEAKGFGPVIGLWK